MQKFNYKKTMGYFALVIAVLLCVTVVAAFGTQSLKNADITRLTPMANAQVNSTYGTLFHGSTYRYTDYTKVEDMHAGIINDDTQKVEVNSKEPHGTKENPFVIDSTSQWNDFAADMGDTSNGITNYGEGSYFIITKDLDFNGVTFKAVPQFKGTLYGLGHTILNISCSFANDTYSGLFMITDDGCVITDINVKDAYFSAIKNVSGFICGVSNGAKILNCHANGNISRETAISTEAVVGGIVGKV